MTATTLNTLMRNVLRSAIYLIFFMAAIVLFALGPKIESLISPVIGAFEIEKVWQEKVNGQKQYMVEGAMLKIRGECEPTEIIMWAGGGFADNNAKIVKIDFSPDPVHIDNQLVTRPQGSQHWGPWRLVPPREPLGPILTLVARHRCHSLWQQTQIIYTGLTTEFFPDLVLDTQEVN